LLASCEKWVTYANISDATLSALITRLVECCMRETRSVVYYVCEVTEKLTFARG
jgi:hypothetical protein